MRLLVWFVSFALLAGGAASAFADCASPAGSTGSIRYASNYNTMAYCDGTRWVSMAGGVSQTINIGGTVTNNTPGGSANSVQYSNGTSFAGDGVFTYNGAGTLAVTTLNATSLGGTLTTAAQPNITSVGILTGLGVAGTITATTVSATTLSGTTVYAGALYVGGQQVTAGVQADRITSGTAYVLAMNNVGGKVSGTWTISSTGNETCSASNYYAQRVNPTTGKLEMCASR